MLCIRKNIALVVLYFLLLNKNTFTENFVEAHEVDRDRNFNVEAKEAKEAQVLIEFEERGGFERSRPPQSKTPRSVRSLGRF